MSQIYYLKRNVDEADKFKVEIPEDIYLPLNMGRSIARNKVNTGVNGQTVPYNYSISLKDWINSKIDEGVFTVEFNTVYSTQDITIGNTTYGPNTTLDTIINAIVTNITNNNTDARHEFTQSSPDTVWSITHNLGKKPSITIMDDSGNMLIPDITYVDDNTVRLTFNTPMSGVAYLN